ncbi:ABC transporter ATP-binding protein [Ruegeria halocynthiae]|uniref:ABC transporter ATP-binding protein n=1 Tax=Ruegeria halocynthiae TaxID=985054 RepID=UPI00055CC108|nr:ABC transporter ATP-binding protein [Ruegeria halocynthiae]
MAYDLQLKNVGKVYDNGTPAVIDFDLNVEKGEFIAFLGPSGCGKSTTLRMISGFETITTGDLLIRGQRVNDQPPEKRPTSMIFQNYALFPHMNVRQNVRFGLEVKGLPKAEADQKVDGILDKLGLLDISEMPTNRLSGGQRQRIALARSLVVEPDILLLDEPLGALDANLRKSIQNELKLLQRDLGITFVFVTHAQSEALALSDRIIVMNAGRIEQISPPHELYTRPTNEFVARFIGSNTIIPGTVKATQKNTVTLDTPFGAISGTNRINAAHSQGEMMSIVLPAEAVELIPGETDLGQLRETFGPNTIPCTIERLQVIGHIMQMLVRLENGETINIEGHVDKYRGRLTVGASAYVAWQSAGATIIAQ